MKPEVTETLGDPDRWIIHKHAAWLCIAAAGCAGFSVGFAVAAILLVVVR